MKIQIMISGAIGILLGSLVMFVFNSNLSSTDEKQSTPTVDNHNMSMDDMTGSLKDKSGDDFDKAFISSMIVHHQGAVDMAEMAKKNSKHKEIKKLSNEIITAQKKEIEQMRQWQAEWGYLHGH